MKCLLLIAGVLALASARPEVYKETEDFQYSRSSTDEGSKSGFYGAQRGNMGGNYERAHNMDGLAQHQMSSAVKQVEGELGEASKMKTGSVYTAATSGGIYGNRNFDLSNLQGRNFEENYDASQSQASLSSHHSSYNDQLASSSMQHTGYSGAAHNSGYNAGYHGTKNYGYGQSALQSGNLQAADTGSYEHGAHATQGSSHSSGYAAQTGYQSHSVYDSTNNNNQYSTKSRYATVPENRLIYTAPVRVYGRPGSRVAVPIAVQSYDGAHATHSASVIDQNAINSEAELLNTGDQYVTLKPVTHAKGYESSYNYRKQWEKHDVKPEVIALAVPTASPYPKASELYDDSLGSSNQYHASGLNSQSAYSNMHHGYNSNVKTSSAASQHLSTANSHQSAATSNAHNSYNIGSVADVTDVSGGIDTKPKSYQSSYSYHKAWERQGDPYEIPVGGSTGLESQRLTSGPNYHGYSSQHGSNYHRQTHQGYSSDDDCDPCAGHVRVARSYDTSNQYEQQRGDWTQQSQISEDQQDLRQQSQNLWDTSATSKQHNELEDLGQQVQQNRWDTTALRRHGQSEHLEDLGQQVQQNNWDTSALRRHGQSEHLEDLGQQVQQNNWDTPALRRHGQSEHLEGLGQQVQQNNWDTSALRQYQKQHNWDRSENLEQSQSKWRY